MPVAARADSEYLAGTFCGGSRISVNEGSDDEHPSASLRHSEVTAVENPPCQAVPEVGQRSKHDSEVPTAVRGEQSGYVLDEYPSRSKSPGDADELVKESGALACESSALSGDGHVLAGEPSAEEVRMIVAVLGPCPAESTVGAMSVSAQLSGLGSFSPALRNFAYVLVDGHSRPSGPQHVPSIRVGLAEEDMSHPGSVESVVEPSDSAEKRGDCSVTHLSPPSRAGARARLR